MSPRRKNNSVAPFSKRLTELRKGRQLTQAELADKIGISRSVIGYYEANAQNPTLDTLQKFADFFGVSVSELIEDPESAGRPGPLPVLDRQIRQLKKLSPTKQRMISNMLEGAIKSA